MSKLNVNVICEGTTFLDNLKPAYAVSDGMQQDFFSIFSIFFPAVSGIQAGKTEVSSETMKHRILNAEFFMHARCQH